jgi:hypothetical protein
MLRTSSPEAVTLDWTNFEQAKAFGCAVVHFLGAALVAGDFC